MQVSDPKYLLDKLDDKALAKIEEQFGGIDRFIKGGDKLKFTCDRSGRCCKNRFDNPIILSPYDTYRIQQHLQIDFEEFTTNYAENILGAESQLPLMLLKFPWIGKNKNECVFIGSSGCRIYDNRPLVCRMYPVGRITDREMNSYYFIPETADYCQFGKGREYTIEDWLMEADVEPYLEWSNRYNNLFLNIDHEKYRSKSHTRKCLFGEMLYDFDVIGKTCQGERPEKLNRKGKDARLHNSYELVKVYVKKFLT